MRKPLEFRFTLSNPIEGEQPIDEPIGWDKSKFTLKRDPKYHSLLFEYSTSLKFYYANSQHNGGGEFIKFIENKYGPDGEVSIKIETSSHGAEWEVFFTGRLILLDLSETRKYVECTLEQGDFFTTFNLRSDLLVSFKDNTSVDGFALQSYEPYDLTLHSKVLIKEVLAEVAEETNVSIVPTHNFTINAGAPGFPDPGKTGGPTAGDQPDTEYAERTSYISLGFTAGRKELGDYWDVGTVPAVASEPSEIYTVREAGLHTFNVNVSMDIMVEAVNLNSESTYLPCGGDLGGFPPPGLIEHASAQLFFVVKDVNDVVVYTNTFHSVSDVISGCNAISGTIPVTGATFTLTDYHLEVDDQVFVYAAVRMFGTYARKLLNAKVGYNVGYLVKESSSLRIIGKTFTENTTGPAMRVHDVLQNIVNKITNRNDTFYSETFGYPGAPYHSYTEKGCFADFAILNGFNLRGFPWELRPLQSSFVQLYDSLDALFSLSLSLELIVEVWKIRVEKRSYNYIKEPVLTLTGVNNIKRTIAKDKFYNEIKVGYKDWQPKDLNGLDEANTIHTYATALQTIGKPLTLISDLIASGSLIEVTRRLQYDATVTTDSEYDEALFIIALNHGDPTVCEKNENFPTVNNLLSPETAYNLELSPARNLLRHGGSINGGLLKKTGSEYTFQGGEGNYLMETSTSNTCPGSYNSALLKENQNIKWAYADKEEVRPLWTTYESQFKFPLTMEEIAILKANKGYSIEINGDLHESGQYEEMFVLEVETEPTTGLAVFKCLGANALAYDYTPIDVDNLLLEEGGNMTFEDETLILLL